MPRAKGRARDYTEAGIRRVPCCVNGCRNKARFQWRICADGNRARALCAAHDVELNEMVLRWAFGRSAASKARAYRRKVEEAEALDVIRALARDLVRRPARKSGAKAHVHDVRRAAR